MNARKPRSAGFGWLCGLLRGKRVVHQYADFSPRSRKHIDKSYTGMDIDCVASMEFVD
jgi:hypothetical protein